MRLMLAEVASVCTKSDVDFLEVSLFDTALRHRAQLPGLQTN